MNAQRITGRTASIRKLTALATFLGAINPTTVASEGVDRLSLIDPLIASAIEAGDLPGSVVAIGKSDGVALLKAYGDRCVEPVVEPMTTDTIFDLASLTKPIATATCVMQLIEEGRLRLRDKPADLLPGFEANGKGKITIEQLLVHSAGFIPDNALEDYRHGPEEAWRRINDLSPRTPPGAHFKYSDVSFLVLGRIVEQIEGRPLDEVARARLFEPLGMDDTGFRPDHAKVPRIAPTTQEEGRWLRGQVHDPRASLLDGVAGHAGLFGTAGDLSRYARAMLSGGTLDGQRLLSQSAIAEMTRARDIGGQLRGLGWDMRSGYSRNRGELMSPAAFGHGGFTGTGIWIDPGQDLFVVFLSSRLHPDGEGAVNDLIGRISAVASACLATDPNKPVTATRQQAAAR